MVWGVDNLCIKFMATSNNRNHNKIVGNLGENMASKFLVKHDFNILDRNYRKKWGEIDIVAQKSNILHFVEVKSVVSCGTAKYMPEENVHLWKFKRLVRVIQTYLTEKQVPHETEWQIDVIAVFLDDKNKKASFRFTENIIM